MSDVLLNVIAFDISDRDEKRIAEIETYLKAVNMFRNFLDTSQDPVFSEVNLTFYSCFI